MKLMQKKNMEGSLQDFILSVVGVAVILAVGLIILSQLADGQATANRGNSCGLNATGGTDGIDYTGCGAAYNSTNSIITQLANVPNWIGIIITVSLAFIVLGYFSRTA